ncbi:tetratricopeptide repeat protein [Shewanella livingstonensis]|uniref:Uncharacterized protein n=1 Tax=Shewanella livingstonensis TaxID=150120 RepID=A0A3G8LQX3_9GAMM|nr:tetratricopeptide repeat protein [Shewanella livingstonensis]AZG71834.1 hypothetical protein EGC82_03095 [Shewanella livingstonensis]
MSVIIKMLNDLEQRQQPGTENSSTPPVGEFVRPQVQYQSVTQSRSPLIGLIIVTVLLIPTLWFGVSMYRQSNLQIASDSAAIDTATENNIKSLVLSPPQNNNSGEIVLPQQALSSTPTPIQKPIQASTEVNTAAIIQDSSIQTEDQISKLDTPVKSTALVAKAVTNDMPEQQASVKEPKTVKAQPILVATETATDKTRISSSNAPAANEATSNQIANNTAPLNRASNSLETNPVLTAAEFSGSVAQAAVVSQKPVDMTIKEVVLSKAQMAQLQYRKAMDAEQAQRLDDAAGYYLEAIILQPSLHNARKQLVEIYYAQNNPTTAMRLLESGISMFPQQWEFYVILSRIQIEIKAYNEALSTVAMIPDKSSWARDKWIAQTDLAQNSKNFALAEAAYRNLLVSESTQSRWWMGLGYALDSQKKYSQAAQAYRSALSYEGLSTSAMTFIEKRLDQLGENR